MINVIKTGSKGNAVLLNSNILIDIGVSYKCIEPFKKDIQYVLLTHIHSDHFNKSTIRKLANERPNIKFLCCEWLLKELSEIISITQIYLIETKKRYDFNDFEVIVIETKHNVRNCAYKLKIGNKKIFFATDLNNLNNIVAKKYDYYLVEANYDETEIAEKIKQKLKNGEFIYEYDVVNNHLSIEKATNFILENAGVNSEYILLHQHKD